MRSALLALALLVAPLHALAQTPTGSVSEGVRLWETARVLYADQRFEEARPLLIEAVQADPLNAGYYLGLARTVFWLGEYDLAVFYYDLYLGELAARIASDAPARNRPDRVRDERNSANASRENPDAPLVLPSAQEQARAALDQRMVAGPILVTSGGGAVSVYEALLRAGYARPDLVDVRARLASALVREATTIVPTTGTRLPALRFDEWEAQRHRWSLATQLAAAPEAAVEPAIAGTEPADPAPVVVDGVNTTAHTLLCDAQLQFMNQNWERSRELFELALVANPDLLPAYAGRLNAIYWERRGTTAVADVLTAFAEAIARTGAQDDGVLDVYRAAFLSLAGRDDEAALLLGEILGVGGATP
jgi:tetratricopeptide (TPR) repeat protein